MVRRLVYAAVTASAIVLAGSVPAAPVRAAAPFVLLQMNLWNSGMATTSCYSFGRAVDEAVGKIHRYPPELVTLQEVCRDDLYARDGWGRLAQAMADLYGSEHISVSFAPAINRDTDDWYRCVNGEPFGNAVMHHDDGTELHQGRYASQDPSNELRVWMCTTVIRGRLTGCTTHLSTDPAVAVRQCRELAAMLASPWVQPEVIIAGDFNLKAAPGKPYDVEQCVPAGYERRSDSTLQHVFFTRNLPWVRGWYEDMRWTDHPLLYERFRA